MDHSSAQEKQKSQGDQLIGLEGLEKLKDQLQAKGNDQESPHALSEGGHDKPYAKFNTQGNPSFEVISTFAYLIGVNKQVFDHPHEPPQLTRYEELDREADARIIRNLCRIRTSMTKHFRAISQEFFTNLKNIDTLPAMIPSDAVQGLWADGLMLYKSPPTMDAYMQLIHRELTNRIHTVKRFFPDWLKWDYVKPLFLISKGDTPAGQKKAGDAYNADRSRYPYQVFLNWDAYAATQENQGNILYNDEKFVLPLYQRNKDRFLQLSHVRGTHAHTMENLSGMLEKCTRVMVAVDCENSDAIKLSAVFNTLSEAQMSKIEKVIFYDSEQTTAQWSTLVEKLLREVQATVRQGNYNPWTVSHQIVPRINIAKSAVDTTMVAYTMKAVYTEGFDGVILVSSDSDFVPLIKALEHVHFLVLLETEKTAMATLDQLLLNQTPFCLMDDFCTSASYSIKTSTIIHRLQGELDQLLSPSGDMLNLRTLLDNALYSTWVEMTPSEKKDFYNRYLQKLRLTIDGDGNARLLIDRG